MHEGFYLVYGGQLADFLSNDTRFSKRILSLRAQIARRTVILA